MTHNQINYWNLQESKRHNVSVESEAQRHNLRTESIDIGNLNELTRHNLATEKRDMASLAESIRHNTAQESISSKANAINAGVLAESSRHNQVQESISRDATDSQIDLNTANKAYTEVRTTWEALLGSNTLELTSRQKDEIQARIDKMGAEIANLDAKTKQVNTDVFWKAYDEIVSLIESLIPG